MIGTAGLPDPGQTTSLGDFTSYVPWPREVFKERRLLLKVAPYVELKWHIVSASIRTATLSLTIPRGARPADHGCMAHDVARYAGGRLASARLVESY